MFKEETSFVRAFLSYRNPQLQIGADSRLHQHEVGSRSDSVGDSLKGTVKNCGSVAYVSTDSNVHVVPTRKKL